jgi:HAL2 family 3'(2'),5'-bisphosphate nucleotidase
MRCAASRAIPPPASSAPRRRGAACSRRSAAAGEALLASPLAAELEAAATAVRLGARLASNAQRAIVTGTTASDTASKADASPVTIADYAAQALISHTLFEAFPSIPLLGEEDASALRAPGGAAALARVTALVGAALRSAGREPLTEAQVVSAIDRGTAEGGRTGRHWVLDPIDGTKGFMRGRQYTVALALVDSGRVALGLLGCPNLAFSGVGVAPGSMDGDGTGGVLFAAARGCGAVQVALHGAALRDAVSALKVDASRPAKDARYVESWNDSICAAHGDCANVAAALGAHAAAAAPIRLDSCAKYGVCARGEAELYLRFPPDGYLEKVWDHAAGALLFEEAGGIITDGAGRPLDFGNGRFLDIQTGIVAAPAHLHAPLLKAVQATVKRSNK